MRPPIRRAALMGLHVVPVFTHDSIALGEDGPTHQPVEQLAGLRAIPNLIVIRPGDANETAVAWRVALEMRGRPVVLVLTTERTHARLQPLRVGGRPASRRLRTGGRAATRLRVHHRQRLRTRAGTAGFGERRTGCDVATTRPDPLNCLGVGWAQHNERSSYDEPYRRMDGRLDGRRDVDLAADRRTGGGPSGRHDQQTK
jgi:hypothetical protein